MDESLWKIDRYADFLEARKELLAAEANLRFAELLHSDDRWIAETARLSSVPAVIEVAGGISSAEEEAELQGLNTWVTGQGFAEGIIAFDHSNAETGDQIAIFDLAWPNGLQEELSEPVAVLLNESDDTVALASAAGFRCFTSTVAFKDYVHKQMFGE
jgi:hypothetical protein